VATTYAHRMSSLHGHFLTICLVLCGSAFARGAGSRAASVRYLDPWVPAGLDFSCSFVVEVDVDANGEVFCPHLVEATGVLGWEREYPSAWIGKNPLAYELNESMMSAIDGAEWTPAQRDGSSVDTRLRVRFEFDPEFASGEITEESTDIRLRAKKDSKPELRTYTPPSYPKKARDLRVEGVVMVSVLVGTEGKVVQTEVTQSVHPFLDEAAVDAIQRAVFTPAMLCSGERVPVWISFPFDFKLN